LSSYLSAIHAFLARRCLPQTVNEKEYVRQAVLSSSDEELDNEPCVSSG
jgi:hypothetical protein